MYNEKQKKLYINSRKEDVNSASMKNIVKAFDNTEKYEKEFGIDLSNWSVDEIITFYKSLSTSSVHTLNTINSYFRSYTLFCMENNLVKDNQNHFDEINIEMYRMCLNKVKMEDSFVTRDELLKIVDGLDNPSDQFILLGVFEGLFGSAFVDLMNARVSDISGNKMKLYSGKVIEISDKLKTIAYNSANEYIYSALTPDESPQKLIGDKDLIIKYIKYKNEETRNPERRLIHRMRKLKNKYGTIPKSVTLKRLYENGRIDFIKRKSKEYGVTPKEFLKNKEYRKLVEIQYKPITNISNYLSMYSKYLE